jgi:hypothetical protein
VLATVELIGMYMAAKRHRWGWAVLVVDQALWFAYAIVTGQWGFLATATVWGAMFLGDHMAWNDKPGT